MMKKLLQVVILMLILDASMVSADNKVYTIEDACNAALVSNEIIKIAEENVFQSDDHVDQAWTSLYPKLTATSSYTRYNDTLPRGGGAYLFQPLDQFEAALVVTQPLYKGGRALAALRTAKKYQETSRSSLSIARQEVLLMVSEAYYGVLRAQKTVEITKHSFERMAHHKEVTEREAGTRKSKANVSSLLRANTLVSQAQINLVRAQDGLKVAREKLNVLTKLPKDALVAAPRPPDEPAETLEQLVETALKNRDDYASSRANQSIASENITIVTGSHYPQIYAEAGLTYLDSRPSTLMDATTYYGGLRLSVPIFEGGLMKSEVSEARSKMRQAELSTDFLRRAIESEVQEAFVNLQTITSVLDTAKLQMEYAKGNFDAVEGLFSEGLLPSLSLIDAEQALTMAERELMNAVYDRDVAILRLKKSTGMLRKAPS